LHLLAGDLFIATVPLRQSKRVLTNFTLFINGLPSCPATEEYLPVHLQDNPCVPLGPFCRNVGTADPVVKTG